MRAARRVLLQPARRAGAGLLVLRAAAARPQPLPQPLRLALLPLVLLLSARCCDGGRRAVLCACRALAARLLWSTAQLLAHLQVVVRH
jgi:hypothetical protein